VLLVDRRVVGEERALGEEEAGHRLARDVDEARDAEAHRGLERVEGRHQVVLEHGVRRVVLRVGQRGGVDDGVVAAHHGVGVAGGGEVRLHVGRGRLGGRRLEDRRAEVARRDVVAGVEQGGDGGRSDLAERAGDEDAHDARYAHAEGRVRGRRASAAAGRLATLACSPKLEARCC